jgi:hypothetical protein
MRRLWNDLLNEPVLVFTMTTAGWQAAATATGSAWVQIVTLVWTATAGAVTRHYVTPERKLKAGG